MNHIYRVIWSKAHCSWIVVCEQTRSGSKSGNSIARKLRRGGLLTATGALLAGTAFADPATNALPTGAQITAGQAAISQTGNTLTVQQSSDKAIINWQSFDVGSQAAVKFAQPGADSVALNRIQSQSPSQIFGKFSANGQVFLLNSGGIIFGPEAKVDVGGIVAGAMKITDEDFLAGRYKFTDGKGVVTNRGTITASDGGLIALLAPEVRNEGIIRARLGTIVLAAGEAITLTNSASGISVVIDKGVFNALVQNGNLVAAEDGRVFMSARAADALQRAVIRNTGVIEAHNARKVGSVIRLEADSVENTGTIDASGTGAMPGGSVAIAAHDVTNTGTILANNGGDIGIAATGAVSSSGILAAKAPTASAQIVQESAPQAGTITISSDASVTLSGTIDASSAGTGGSIVVAGPHVTMTGATVDASGGTAGGTIFVKPSAPQPTDNPQPDPTTLLIDNAVLRTDSRRSLGGLIDVAADDVTLANASLSATGETGGGRIFVGGHWQGGDGAFQATHSSIDATSLLDASATGAGNGGVIVVWSDVHNLDSITSVAGTLRATGGTLGGDGGRIETSGHQVDTGAIKIDASSLFSIGGLWLLDPYDYTIGATQAGYISTALSAGTSVTISTQSASNTQTGNTISGVSGNGDITVSSAITKSGGGTATLTLQADRNITISTGANITSTSGLLNITLSADNAGSASVGGISLGANLSSNGGTILIGGAASSASHGIAYARNFDSSNPAIAIKTNVSISSSGGNITINGTSTGTTSSYSGTKGGIYVMSGATVSSSGGNIYLSGISTTDAKEFGFAVEGNSGTVTTIGTGSSSGTIFLDAQNTVNALGSLGLLNNGTQQRIVFVAPTVAGILISLNGSLQASTFTYSSSYDSTYLNTGIQQVNGGNNSYLYATYRVVTMATHAFYVSTSTTSRVYDGTTTASGLTLTTTAAPGDYSTTGLSFATSSKNVGTYNTLSVSGTNATTFHSTSTGFDYAIGYFYNPYTITQKSITGITGITATSKQYDGGTSATLSTGSAAFTGMIVGDVLMVASGTGVFATKNVGTGKTVNISGLTLGGTDASNYTLASSTATGTGDITAKVLSISGLTVQNKTYDGTTTATFSGTPTLSGVLGGETVNLSGTASAAFADKNAGNGKTVTVTGLSLSGTDAGNYTLSGSTSTATANIAAATISAITGITASNKTYDGSTAATLNTGSAAFAGKISGDTLTVASGNGIFANKNVANGKTVTITGLTLGGTDAGNYVLSSTTASTSANITTATISAITGITAVDKTYDGSTSASLTTSGANFTGKIAGDTLTVASATGAFGDKTAASNKTVTITGLMLGGADAGNYTLASTTASTTATIAAKVLTITGVSINNKVYDGTTAATLSGSAGLSGVIGSDDVSASGSAVASFSDKNVGDGKTVSISGLSLGGADAGNYTLSGSTASATANITKATISAITGITATNKAYDGTTSASLITTGAGFTGKISGDTLTVASGTGTFADKNAADGKTVSIIGLGLGGTDAGNYTLSDTTATATADIAKAAITTITGITASNKTYDGTTAATINTAAAAFTGKISGDTLTIASGTGSFADKNAADGKTVSITGLTLGGSDAANYTLSLTTAFTTANIGKATISAITGITASNKAYDGTTAATINTGSAAFAGKIFGDTLTVAMGAGTFADKNAGDGKTVSITGLGLGGTDAGNYTLSDTTATTIADISKATITAITGLTASNKTYDGTTAATLNTGSAAFTGQISGDSLTVASGTGCFADKNAADGKTVSITGLTLGGSDAGNYTLSLTTGSTTANIAKATIMAITGLTASNKTYDGTTAATLNTGSAAFTGKISGDTLTVASGTGNFADKNAGDGKSVSITGLSLGGTDAANYTLSSATASTSADIAKATISAVTGIAASNKTYDGTTAATLDNTNAAFTGKVSGDTLTVASGTGTFADKNAADGKTVSISGLTLGGADAGNYSLSDTTATTTANIGKAAVSGITGITANNKTYDGTTTATINTGSAAFTGKISGDTLIVASGTGSFADKNAADGKTVSITGLTLGGSDAGNYTLSLTTASTTANIGKAAITAVTGITASNKTYDGTTGAALNAGSAAFTGKIAGDTLTVASGTGAFSDKNVGDGKTVTITALTLGGSDAGNYMLASTTASTTADIAKAVITGITGITAANKTYDGGTGATLNTTTATFTGKIGGDALTVANGSATFGDKSAATGKTVTITGLALGGSDAGNYTLSTTTASTTADITPKVLTITGVSITDKVYDGTTTATLSGAASLSGVIGSDDVSASGSAIANFDNKNVGTNKTVDISGLTLGGADAGNYSLTGSTASATANITKATISAITGIAASNKTYDGTTTATLDNTNAAFTGKIAGDTLTVASGTGTFADKNAGDGKTVSITGLTLGGTDAGNYTLSLTTGSAIANIAKATISAITGLTASNKTYDGTTAATLDAVNAGFTGKIAGDTLTVASGTGAFVDKNADNGKTVAITRLSLGGADAGNYTLENSTGSASANITAKVLTVTGVSINNKVYDGTTTATLLGAPTLSGVIGSDDVAVSGLAAANFADKNVGNGKSVTISGLTLNGADAGNYSLTGTTASATANITKATISAISGITAADKTYDGTTAATLDTTNASFTGKIVGDTLTITTGTGSFADKNAGNGKTVTITGLSLGGTDAGNYILSDTTASATATIAKATISAINGITATNKTYDGTTAAGLNTTNALFSGKLGGDILTLVSGIGNFADKNAGNGKTVSITGLSLGGADAGNYTLSLTTASTVGNIAKAAISITGITADDKTYDGTTTATLNTTGAGFSGLIAGDTLTVGSASGSFADKNAGAGKTVTISGLTLGGGDAGNYILVSPSATATASIAKAPISAIGGITANAKTYDGTTAASLNTGAVTFAGAVSGDSLTLAAASGNFANKNAGTGKIVTISGLTLGGADAANYEIAFTTVTATADIAPKTVSVSGATVSSKTFDGSDTATISGATLTAADIVPGDQIALANQIEGTFASANPGQNIAVATEMTLTGPDSANYTLVQPANLAGTINATQSAPRQPDTTTVVPTVMAATATPPVAAAIIAVPQPAISNEVTEVPPVATQPTTPAATPASSTYVLTTASTIPTTPASGGAAAPQDSQGFTSVRNFDPVSMNSGSSFAFTLPGDTFKHSDSNATITLSATTQSGSPLPDWVRFSTDERRFTGTAPEGLTELKLIVTARDQLGNEATTTITLHFGEGH